MKSVDGIPQNSPKAAAPHNRPAMLTRRFNASTLQRFNDRTASRRKAHALRITHHVSFSAFQCFSVSAFHLSLGP
jgi:hypothetical protein